MSTLIISDLHLTDNPLEDYRWGVFPWILDLHKEYNFDRVYVLGDLTEKKDNHGAKLVNRMATEFGYLSSKIDSIYILRGNHDAIDPNQPFFGFLNQLGIKYLSRPYLENKELFIPNTKTFQDDLSQFDLSKVEAIFLHQTFTGVNYNGIPLQGTDPNLFSNFDGLIISGDIHTPQTYKNIVYVGAPYPIYFGDDYVGGGIIIDDDEECFRIENETIGRINLELDFTGKSDPWEIEIKDGYQYKIRLLVSRSDSDQFSEFRKKIKEIIQDKGGIVVSLELKILEEKSKLITKRQFKNIDPLSVLTRYCKTEGLDDFYLNKGKEFL